MEVLIRKVPLKTLEYCNMLQVLPTAVNCPANRYIMDWHTSASSGFSDGKQGVAIYI